MTGLATEYCVEIRVPKKNGHNQFGSGYTLGPHWVLTACHVLFGDDVDEAKQIELTWWDESAEKMKGGKPVLVSRDDIVWQHQEHDIALIRCQPPYSDLPGAWELLTEDKPAGWELCRCAGYLSNLHDESGKQRRETPEGKFGGCSEQENKVDINELTVKLHRNEDWAGFSGSPVFLRDQEKLVAVVRAVKTGEDGLIASFVSAALDSEGDGPGQPVLRELPGFLIITPDRQKCWKRIQAKVIGLLKDTPQAYAALKDDFLSKVNKNARINNSADLAECLQAAQDIEVIQCFSRVSTALRKKRQTQEVRAMRDLACVWLVLLAAEQGTVCGIDKFKKNATAQSLAMKAVEPVLLDVEAQAANAEQRRLHLRLAGASLRSPFDLTPGPVVGFDEDDRQAAQDAQQQYALKNRPGFEVFSLEEAKNALEEFATRPETGLSRPLASDDDVQRGLEIGDQLEWACAELAEEFEEKVSYYIRLAEPVNQDSCFYDLHKWCPQLLIFSVSAIESRERKNCLSGLHRIIHRAETFLNEQRR